MIDQLTRTGASLILDVTALIALAALAAAALRRSSAATRHFVWALALAGALALTLAVPFSPRFDVPVPWPAGAAPQTAALAIAPAASSAGLIAHAAHAPTPAAATRTSEPSTPSGAGLLALIWAAGALAMAARYALGHAGLVRLRRRSVPVVDADWLARLERTRRLLGVTQPVALAVSGDVGSPVTFGARRPIILLPAESEAWEPSLKLDVLRHELAHVARRDVLVQFVSQATSALHWW
ncbi:MAG TPA: M56 family metallopeptidase, partial [Verrucomicrobiae bacterium]|nr:M56 family metallopeptidase [Verrucomicrobiae bacterium]